MKKLLLLLALIAIPFSARAQTPGAQPEFCVTSPSQTANYNQTCISASSSGGTVQVNNFGTATGGLGVGTITSGTWNGTPITNPFIANPFTTINGTSCSLGSSCTISAPTSGLVVGTSSITGGTTNQILYDNGGLVGEISKGNSCLYGTNGTGVPSCLTTLPANLTASSLTAPSLIATNMTVTGSFTATGLVTNADLVSATVTVNSTSCTLGSSCSISAAASLVVGSTTVTSGTTNQILYDNGGTLGEITKGNSCVYGTSGAGVPSCITTLPFVVSLATGGTAANLTASTGGIVYSGASALAILAGTATASLPLLSGSSAAPTWATISYPTSANSGGIPYFSSATVISSSNALGANCMVYGGGAGATPATSATNCPTVSNAGLVAIPNATAATSTAAAALVVTGGVAAATAFIGTSITDPIYYGGIAAGSTNTIQSTSNGSPSGDSDIFAASTFKFQTIAGTGLADYNSTTSGQWTYGAKVNVAVSQASGTTFHVTTTQTQPNAADTGDSSIKLDYTLTANSATNELVNRVFQLDATNNLTGGGVISNLRMLDIVSFTNASTTTTELDHIYIEAATASGTVTTGYGVKIAALQGTTQWGFYNASSGNDFFQNAVSIGTTAVGPAGSLRFTANLISAGTPPTGNTGTCSTGITVAGGATAGTWTSTAACALSTGTIILTAMPTAPTGYVCFMTDRTTNGVTVQETATSATSVTFTVRSLPTGSVQVAANDILQYSCRAY